MGKKHFCFFQTAETGNRTPSSGVKSSGANHYPRAPARDDVEGGPALTQQRINAPGLTRLNASKSSCVRMYKVYEGV